MKMRDKQGSTLSLVVACTIVMAILGIGFIFMTLIFGGHRETQHAADSGSLNVSKLAIKAPFVDETALLGDDRGRCLPQTGMGIGVNLLNFNRMVGQAMLVALNAEADGSQTMWDNATEAWKFVEGTDTSLGAQLKGLLSKGGPDNWAAQAYGLVEGNVLKMLGGQGAPIYNPDDFQAGYLNSRKTDFTASDLDAAAFVPPGAPAPGQPAPAAVLPQSDYSQSSTAVALPADAFVHGPNGQTYLAGYTPIKIGSGANSLTFYLVPNNPNQQPHLESATTFNAQLTQPGEGKVWIPPNAFRIGAIAKMDRAVTGNSNLADAHVSSVSIVGVPAPSFKLQIPNGYIVIDNSDTQSFSGKSPNTDNVAAHELGPGIRVDKQTGFFSITDQIDKWQGYKHDESNFTPTPGKDPAFDAIYDQNGNKLTTVTQAAKIPYTNGAPGSMVICTDNNSSAPNGDPICVKDANPQNTAPLDVFDQAYHPGATTAGGGISTSKATASEMTQCKIIDLYGPDPHGGGPQADYNYSFGPTGIRIYDQGLPSADNQYAWQGPPGGGFGMSPDAVPATVHKSGNANSCQVTRDGSVRELFEQSTAGSKAKQTAAADEAIAFIKQRIKEINPAADVSKGSKIDNWLNLPGDQPGSFPIALGMKYYIYMNTSGEITIDTTGPGYVSKESAQHQLPDGKKHGPNPLTYSILQGVANPYYAYGIHDRLFTTWGTQASAGDDNGGDISATDTATYQAASGAYGLLGIVKFTETSTANGSLAFNNRD